MILGKSKINRRKSQKFATKPPENTITTSKVHHSHQPPLTPPAKKIPHTLVRRSSPPRNLLPPKNLQTFTTHQPITTTQPPHPKSTTISVFKPLFPPPPPLKTTIHRHETTSTLSALLDPSLSPPQKSISIITTQKCILLEAIVGCLVADLGDDGLFGGRGEFCGVNWWTSRVAGLKVDGRVMVVLMWL